MTLEEIKKLSDRELDARLGELLGSDCMTWGRGDSDPHFSQSLDAIAPMEAKTVERFGDMAYLHAIWKITDELGVIATARHRAEAVLFCWEAE